MILNIKERIMLLGLLPQEGSLIEMVDVYDLVRELKLSDTEKKESEYRQEDKNLIWDPDKDPNKDISMSQDQFDIIHKSIDKLSEAGKISIEYIPLILKIRNG